MNMGSMPQARVAGPIGSSPSMGWNIAQGQPIPHSAAALYASPSAGLSLSQYSVNNQQNTEIARVEPVAQGYIMKGSAGDIILAFALEMTQSSNTVRIRCWISNRCLEFNTDSLLGVISFQPMVLIRNPGTNVVIASLTTELKQSKEDKPKDKPKKDKKKEKDEHKDKIGRASCRERV